MLMLAILTCANPVMENVTALPWNNHDMQTLERMKIRCGEVYQDAPCVKLFRKFNYQSYTVICGK